MLTYTKQNVNVITFIFTVIAFFSFHFALNSFTSDISELQSKNINTPLEIKGNNIYAKVIPITNITRESYQETQSVSLTQFDILKVACQTNMAKKVQQENLAKIAKMNGKEGIVAVNNLTHLVDIEEVQNVKSLNDGESMLNGTIEEEQEEKVEQEQQTSMAQMSTTQMQDTPKEPITARQAIKTYEKSTWRIEIPRLNLNVHILEGTSSNILLKAVGHFEDMSTWNGNVGLAAHNRGYHCNFFQNIKKLKQGDTIIYHTSQGTRKYKVILNKVIEETNWTYLNDTKDNRITLITCEENRRSSRRCVQAMEVK